MYEEGLLERERETGAYIAMMMWMIDRERRR
jgi:hypothetical protein